MLVGAITGNDGLAPGGAMESGLRIFLNQKSFDEFIKHIG